jgi:hypothetical protein
MHGIDVLFRVVSLPLYFVAQEDVTLKRGVLPAQPPRLVKAASRTGSTALRKTNHQRVFELKFDLFRIWRIWEALHSYKSADPGLGRGLRQIRVADFPLSLFF